MGAAVLRRDKYPTRSVIVVVVAFMGGCASSAVDRERPVVSGSSLGIDGREVETYAYCGRNVICEYGERLDWWVVQMTEPFHHRLLEGHGADGAVEMTMTYTLGSQQTETQSGWDSPIHRATTSLAVGSIEHTREAGSYWLLERETICSAVRQSSERDSVFVYDVRIADQDVAIVPIPGLDNSALGWFSCPEAPSPSDADSELGRRVHVYASCGRDWQCEPGEAIDHIEAQTDAADQSDLNVWYELGDFPLDEWSLPDFNGDRAVPYALTLETSSQDSFGYSWTLYPDVQCSSSSDFTLPGSPLPVVDGFVVARILIGCLPSW